MTLRHLVLVAAFAAAGCATTAEVVVQPPAAPVRRPPLTPRVVDGVVAPVFGVDDEFAYVDGATGQQLSAADAVVRLRGARAVVIGEQHDQRSHHALQARLVAALGADGPGLVVGMEMLSWDKQEPLDRFNRGDLTEVALRDAVDWKKAWGFDFDLYAPIFQAGRSVGARFVALNAPRELVRAMRKGGVDALSVDDRARLPELDLGDELHRAWFEKIFSSAGHPMKPAEIDAFYRAQVLWDESMADRAAQALSEGARQVVVIAGAGHVANGRGIPQRVERRINGRVLAVVPLTVDADSAVDGIVDAVRAGEADILVIPRFEPEIHL